MASDKLSQKWSDRFDFFNNYGLPGSTSYREELKTLRWSKRGRFNFNFYGFFFGFIYFCILGLWKKGLVLLLSSIILTAIIIFLEYILDVNLSYLYRAINVSYAIFCGMSVNAAYYLQTVKEIDSWNPLQGMTKASAYELS